MAFSASILTDIAIMVLLIVLLNRGRGVARYVSLVKCFVRLCWQQRIISKNGTPPQHANVLICPSGDDYCVSTKTRRILNGLITKLFCGMQGGGCSHHHPGEAHCCILSALMNYSRFICRVNLSTISDFRIFVVGNCELTVRDIPVWVFRLTVY